jgi:hypothetical protein
MPRPATIVTWVIAALAVLSVSAITAFQVLSGPDRTADPTQTRPAGLPTSVDPLTPPQGPGPTTAPPTAVATTRTATTVPARSGKKGVSTWDFPGLGAALRDVGARWYYNWSAGPSAGAGTTAEFVPMI